MLTMKVNQNVVIKGTKDGLTFHLNDSCSYFELLNELEEKLTETFTPHDEKQKMSVNVEVGNRYLTEEQIAEIKTLVQTKGHLIVENIESQVMTKVAAEELLESRTVTPIMKIIRSGQVLRVPGDLLLVGDVNPGGSVIAGGNIYILGSLKGNAHAGFNGKNDAVIAASNFTPLQIKISDLNFNELAEKMTSDDQQMKCAYINENGKITVDRLQVLPQMRPQLTSLKGEM